ncbi:hypothetical protein CerSpe_033760 [Prunus speciosa]
MAPVALFVFSLLTHLVVLHSTEEGELYNERCPPFSCNDKVGYIQFPLKHKTHPPECGLFTVDCSADNHSKIQLKKDGYWHEFERSHLPNMVLIDDKELQQRLKPDSCNDQFFNDLSLPSLSPIFDTSLTYNLTLFKCNNSPLPNTDLKIHCNNDNHTYYTSWSDDSLPSLPPSCSIIQIPLDAPDQPPSTSSLPSLATKFHFLLKVSKECEECYIRKGECGVDDKGKFKCSVGEKGVKLGLKLGLGKIDISEVKYIIDLI